MTLSEGTYYPFQPPSFALNWIRPEDRTKEQRVMTAEFHEEIGLWDNVALGEVALPDRCLDYELEIKATGKLLDRPHQLTGCCVGVGSQRARENAIIGDVVLRGDVEGIKLPFALATYGWGRMLAGMPGRGEGSFGAAQAKACQEFGDLPIDYPGLPTPTIKDGWITYTESLELEWSHPKPRSGKGWPIDPEQLRAVAKKYAIGEVTQCKTISDVLQAKAQGKGVTMASEFGTRGCRVQNGVLLADWNGSWAHQMSVAGYWQTSPLGLIFTIDNQWGDVHGTCPVLGPLGVRGSFWITEKSMQRILDTGEVYAHSATGGFDWVAIDWSSLGIKFV